MCRGPQETRAINKWSHLEGNQHHQRHRTAESIHFFAIEIPHLPMLQLPLKPQALRVRPSLLLPAVAPTLIPTSTLRAIPQSLQSQQNRGFLYEPVLGAGTALPRFHPPEALSSRSYHRPCALPDLPYPSSLSWLNAQTAHVMNESPTLFYNSGFP